MNKNIIWILAIFLIPIVVYATMTRNVNTYYSNTSTGNEIIKFSSPMCYECQELEKVIEEVMPKYYGKITLRKIDVTNKDKNVTELIKEYNVTLVPTTVFKKSDGKITRRIEGTMQPKILENYIAELINE